MKISEKQVQQLIGIAAWALKTSENLNNIDLNRDIAHFLDNIIKQQSSELVEIGKMEGVE